MNTISIIIPETCEAIVSVYMPEVMTLPKTPDEWREIAAQFSRLCNFHNTVGAMDGKHIAIRCPAGGGSVYYNYKGFHSIVLLALVDANYKFIYVDIGSPGCGSDAGILSDSPLRQALRPCLLLPPQLDAPLLPSGPPGSFRSGGPHNLPTDTGGVEGWSHPGISAPWPWQPGQRRGEGAEDVPHEVLQF